MRPRDGDSFTPRQEWRLVDSTCGNGTADCGVLQGQKGEEVSKPKKCKCAAYGPDECVCGAWDEPAKYSIKEIKAWLEMRNARNDNTVAIVLRQIDAPVLGIAATMARKAR